MNTEPGRRGPGSANSTGRRHGMDRASLQRIAATAASLIWLFGCTDNQPTIDWSQQIAPLPANLAAEVPQTTPRDTAVHKAIAAVVDGDYPQASRWINLALKLDSTNSNLHFLNGLI